MVQKMSLAALVALAFAGSGKLVAQKDGEAKKPTDKAAAKYIQENKETALLYYHEAKKLHNSIQQLRYLLRAIDEETRYYAAKALAEIGPSALSAVRELTRALYDKSARVRAEATGALARIGPPAKQAVPDLIKRLADEDPQVRGRAVGALRKINSSPEITVPALVKRLEDPGQGGERVANIRLNLVDALGDFGPEAKEATPVLMKLWNESNDLGFKYFTFGALARIKANVDTLIPLCLAILNDPLQEDYYSCAVGALGIIGPQAKEGIPHLLRLFEKCRNLKQPAKAEVIRSTILRALGKMGKEAEEAAVPAIIGYCADRALPSGTRHTAYITLGEIGPSAKAAIPFLIDSLQKREEFNEFSSVIFHALKGIGKEAVKPLINAYLTTSGATKERLIRALGAMGSLAIEAIPFLEMEISNPKYRIAASTAIRRIIPRNP